MKFPVFLSYDENGDTASYNLNCHRYASAELMLVAALCRCFAVRMQFLLEGDKGYAHRLQNEECK